MSDGNDGLWIGAGMGENVRLVQLDSHKQWKIFELPYNEEEIEKRNSSGLSTFTSDNKWNFPNPSAIIQTLVSDNSGGIWIGAHLGGLFHRSFRGDWDIFNTSNSDLPNNRVRALANDGRHGLWVATWGLAHLTFSQKALLCEKVPNISDEDCTNLLESKRSAIIIHPNGSRGSEDNSDVEIDNMATHVYQTLFMRGYDHDEIHYIAHKPNLDFNRDSMPDSIVDAPITLKDFLADEKKQLEPITIEHIQVAFDWAKGESDEAKTKGISEEPLVIIFVGHGIENTLILEPSQKNILDEKNLNRFIKDYQTATNNRVVVILEACQTGTLIDGLQGKNRLIVTSTDEKLAYYKDSGRISFSNFYFNTLNRGQDYSGSRKNVKDDIFTKLGAPFNGQEPQLEDLIEGDKTANNLCLNGCYGQLPEPILTPEALLITDSVVDLAVDISDNTENEVMCRFQEGAQDRIVDVSISVITPQDAQYNDETGVEKTKPLLIKNLNQGENGKWFTRWTGFTQPGEYHFIFRANYTMPSGVRTVNALPVTVDFQCQIHARYNADTRTLHIPAMEIPNDNGEAMLYQAEYLLIDADPITLELKENSIVSISHTQSACVAHFVQDTKVLHMPAVDIPNAKGGFDTFYVELEEVSESLLRQFTLKKALP